jgi:precorrin-4/cobalt-precorrin-4 C11-methyltransferase
MREPSKDKTVFFVGAGPGDPELITVKGRRLLEEADLVLYTGSLVKESALGFCRKEAVLKSSASMDLSEIVGLMLEAVRSGKRVVRLHTGDPSLYGALNEQTAALDREGVAYSVVPGVSSAFASAAALKKELTSPGITQTVIFTRMEGRTPVPDAERLSALAKHGATICIFLSVSMMERVVEELGAAYPGDTPVAVVYRATWEDELIVTGTLDDIAAKVLRAGITKHAMIIVGRAIGPPDRLGPDAASGEASRLYDKGFSHGFRDAKGPGRSGGPSRSGEPDA